MGVDKLCVLKVQLSSGNRLLCEWFSFSCVGVLWNCGMKWVRVWFGGTEDYSDAQLRFALVLQHSCKIYCAIPLVTCVVCGCFVSNLIAAGVSKFVISTGTIWLLLHGDSETHLHFKSKFHWLSFFSFFCCCCFRTWFHWGWGVKLSPDIWHCSWYDTSRCTNCLAHLYRIAF